jgi:dTDP-4-dehydrorhamnose reductase
LSRRGDRTSRKLLVTGGSGYLGRWVVRLACNNWDVTATYLTDASQGLSADWRRLDVRHQALVEALIAELRPEAIVHTAALNPGQGTEFHAVNAEGTRHVARASADVGARLIYISTDVLFDGEKGNYSEEVPPSPITPYGRSKALAEEAVRASGADAVIVRTSLIYGPAADVPGAASPDSNWRHWDRQTCWIVGDLESGKPVHLFTDELRCPIWVRSLASALVELAGRTYTGILHVAGAQALSRYAFGLRLARFHGVDPEGITPALSHESGLVRPLDCTLDCSRAQTLLHTPLPGVDALLARYP